MTRAELVKEIREGMKPTGLDRVITRAFPGWGLKRMEARATLALVGGQAWTGARRDTPEGKNWNPLPESPDTEQRWDRPYLVDRATDLERNDALAGGAIAEVVLSVVGTGLSVQPEPNRKILGWSQDQAVGWAEDVKGRFHLFAGDARECDIARRRNFYQAQAVAYRTVASRGDIFALMPRKRHPGTTWSLKFQLIEGDRCLNPPSKLETLTTDNPLSQGIEVDEFGGVISYSFCKRHPAAGIALSDGDFVSVQAWDDQGHRQVLHLMHEQRLDIRRGYPLLAPVIMPLKQMSRLSEAELAAAVVTSFFAVVVKKNSTGSSPLGGTVTRDQDGKGFAELGPAIVAELNPGEDIEPVTPTRPNGAFDPFWRSLLGQIAMRIQIPPEVLLKKFESSYTAARGALLQFWKFVTVERENLLAPNFCQPLYEAWLDEEVAAGRIKAPGYFANPLLRAAYCNARWVGDNPPILDPLKEVMAAQEMIDYTLSTHADEAMRLNGGDWEVLRERAAREARLLADDGLTPQAKPTSSITPTPDPSAPDMPPTDSNAPSGRSARRQARLDLALREDR